LKYEVYVERITATFDKATAAAIRKVAGRRGVSAFLQQAARERLARLEVIALLDDLDSRYGSPSAAVVADVRREAEAHFPTKKTGKARAIPKARRRR
jgi:hypothetical protein